MKSRQTRSLFIACLLGAPLLAGANGGCRGEVAIGGDNLDAGSGGAAGSGGNAGTSNAGTSNAGTSNAGTSNAGTGNAGASGSGGSADICSLPPETGPCEAAIERWWFNYLTGQCERFTYGGCGGNANNFGTEAECAAACAPGPGEPCGSVRCPAGKSCCNPSCGICISPGQACTTIECTDPCAPQDARAEGACRLLLGYKWDGQACVALGGCSCVGSDCASLQPTLEDCMNSRAGCDAPGCADEQRAMVDFILANKSCATNADCQGLSMGCGITEDGCTGTVYVNTRTDPIAFEALRTDYNRCFGDCAVCERASFPPACVAGRCMRGN